MICHSDFSRLVLDFVNFVDNYTAPRESVEGINLTTRQIKRGQNWESEWNWYIMMVGATNRHRNVPSWSHVERPHVLSEFHCTYRFQNNPTITSVRKATNWRRWRTVLNSRSQLWTTVLGAMIRHVGQVASAGGSTFRSRHALRSCNLETCLYRRFLSVTMPCFFMIADRNDITWTVLPVFDRIINSQETGFNGQLTLRRCKKLCDAQT